MPASDRTRYLLALLAEIRILTRTIAGDADKSLSKLTIAVPVRQQGTNETEIKQKSYLEVVPWIVEADQIVVQSEGDIPESQQPDFETKVLESTAKLQYLRDALISLTAPATGISIAYTTLAAGNERRAHAKGGAPIESSVVLASMAYPNLEGTARRHRVFIWFLCVLAVVLALFASWQATKASLGKNLLQPLEQLRQQQQSIGLEKLKLDSRLEIEVARQRDATPPPVLDEERRYPRHFLRVPLCDRHRLNTDKPLPPNANEEIHFHFNAEIRDVCGRDSVLGKNIARTQKELEEYSNYWPRMAGGLYLVTARSVDAFQGLVQQFVSWVGLLPPLPGVRPVTDTCTPACPSRDIELSVAPLVGVITNFVLPVVMGVIGSLLYVILDHYTRLRSNLLMPRDFALSLLRVILGIVVAISISLLITGWSTPAPQNALAASGSVPPGSIVGSLALSASLITFLAGFGAEAVFVMLQALVLRIFNPPQGEKP